MLNLTRLRVLRELSVRGSFSAVAESLSFTQSAVSQQIATLEREIGTRLVERDRRGPRLTEAGQILLSHAEVILGRLDQAERELSEYVGLRSGRLRLAAFESAGATLVPPAVAAFHDAYPDVELQVVQMEPEEAAAHLANHEIDLAVVYDLDPPTGVLDQELELTYLLDDRYAAVVSKRHPLARRDRIGLTDLSQEAWINTTERDLCHQVVLRSCREAGFVPRVAFEVDEIATSEALVAGGGGVTLLPHLALVSYPGDLAIKSLGRGAPTRRVFAASLARRYRTPASEAMVAILKHKAKGFGDDRPATRAG